MADLNTDWIVLRDEHMVCDRCGTTEALSLPRQWTEVASEMERFVEQHRGCGELSARRKLNDAEQEALRDLINVCDVALARLRKPLFLHGDDGLTNGSKLFEDSVERLGPLCGVRLRAEGGNRG